ncbi:MAG: M28 family peptidase [Ruthenibacterium sp.]
MAVDFTKMLTLLACKDADARRAAMEEALRLSALQYTVQTDAENTKMLHPAQNFLVKIGDAAQPCLLFCAHYDALPGSLGANDNAAAVCILLALARTLSARGQTAEFAFFDAEESGRGGSKLYVRELAKGSVTGVINLDLCGYGDTLVILDKGHAKKKALRPFCGKDILQKHTAQLVKYLPESDDASFRGTQLPSMSLAIVPRWDIQYLNALSTYGGGFLGRPPEFEMMIGQMEVTTTMHGSFRDTLEAVQPDAMQRVYNYLLDACTAEEPAHTRSLFSR